MFQIKLAQTLLFVAIHTLTPAPSLFAGEASWSSISYWGSGVDASPAFTPDGKTVYFSHGIGEKHTIMVSHLTHGAWSKPEIAPFSGEWIDIEPAIAPDGSYLIFVSNRPATQGGKALDGHYGGGTQPGGGGNLWRVNRVGEKWSQPVRLPDVVNSNSSTYAPALVRDGSLYYMQPDPATSKFRLYRSQFARGTFATPQQLSFSDGINPDFDPAVAPDESFIIFSSTRPPTPDKHSGIFIAFFENHRWSVPVPFNPFLTGIESRLSPDLKTLYFTSSQPLLESSPQIGNDVVVSAPTAPKKIWQIGLGGLATMRKASLSGQSP